MTRHSQGDKYTAYERVEVSWLMPDGCEAPSLDLTHSHTVLQDVAVSAELGLPP